MGNKLFIVVVILIILAGLYNFVIHPFKILGADVGIYRNTQVVFGIAKPLVPWRRIQQEDVVVYLNNDDSSSDFYSIASIENPEKTLGMAVPQGYYVVKTSSNDHPYKMIRESEITHVVWFPFK